MFFDLVVVDLVSPGLLIVVVFFSRLWFWFFSTSQKNSWEERHI